MGGCALSESPFYPCRLASAGTHRLCGDLQPPGSVPVGPALPAPRRVADHLGAGRAPAHTHSARPQPGVSLPAGKPRGFCLYFPSLNHLCCGCVGPTSGCLKQAPLWAGSSLSSVCTAAGPSRVPARVIDVESETQSRFYPRYLNQHPSELIQTQVCPSDRPLCTCVFSVSPHAPCPPRAQPPICPSSPLISSSVQKLQGGVGSLLISILNTGPTTEVVHNHAQ